MYETARHVLPAKEILQFCYSSVLQAINSYEAKTFSDFDAHTTANCCHGMSVYAMKVIDSLSSFDLNQIKREGIQMTEKLNALNSENCIVETLWHIPCALIELTSLYLLAFIRVVDPEKGGRTVPKRLKLIEPVGSAFCQRIVAHLQLRFSNLIALGYNQYLQQLPEEMMISGAPIGLWGKYVHPKFLRTDKKAMMYAPCLFSMQVTFAHLIYTRSKIAVINDVITSTGQVLKRQVYVLEGNGQTFTLLTDDDLARLQNSLNEPLVVFGGCCISDDMTLSETEIQHWINRFSHLTLACDTFYPQFPAVTDDPGFDSSPIIPVEEQLNEIIAHHGQIKGVSAEDPSLFCLVHIQPASIDQILKIKNGYDPMALRISYIFSDKKHTHTQCLYT